MIATETAKKQFSDRLKNLQNDFTERNARLQADAVEVAKAADSATASVLAQQATIEELKTQTAALHNQLTRQLKTFEAKFFEQSSKLEADLAQLNGQLNVQEICADPDNAEEAPPPFQSFIELQRYLFRAPFEKIQTIEFTRKRQLLELEASTND